MKEQKHQIVKPDYHSDIYTQLNRMGEFEQELNLVRVMNYKPEEEKVVYLFSDVKNLLVFSYWTRPEGQEQNDEVTSYLFNDVSEFLDYLTKLKEEFKDDKECNMYDLPDRIKETKLFMDSKKKGKFETLRKDERTLKVGDLLYTSWGYDQTNVEMFRIVKFLGQNYFILQEVSQKTIEGSEGFMCSTITAGFEDLDKLPIKGFVNNKGYMSVCESGYKRSLFMHEKGQEHYTSHYH